MSNKELLDDLKRLKKEGISYKYIATELDIPITSFYKYTSDMKFPYLIGKQVEDYIYSNFYEVLNDE